jgi:MoxR-like ATPase
MASMNTITLDERQIAFLEACIKEGYASPLKRSQIKHVCHTNKIPMPSWIVNDDTRRVAHGLYSVPELHTIVRDQNSSIDLSTDSNMNNDSLTDAVAKNEVTHDFGVGILNQDVENLIPKPISTYVPFGAYSAIERIIQKNRFYPVYISGLSGNGKTTMVQQICATNAREFIRASITKETDEDDLVGGFRLINGESVWVDGPAIIAMKRGAILLLDEVNLNPDKIMCLQPVMEGNGIFLKKINKYVYPTKGFNIIATANGKGQGSEEGYDKFIGAQVMNEAFLERFAVTIEHEYPEKAVEKKIVLNLMKRENCVSKEFADSLVKWADNIRKTYAAGGLDDLITTRRLEHIVTAYAIFEDRHEAVKYGIARFNKDTKQAFYDLYTKLDPIVPKNVPTPEVVQIIQDTDVVFLRATYDERVEAAKAGAVFDGVTKRWTITGAQYKNNPSAFDKWEPYINSSTSPSVVVASEVRDGKYAGTIAVTRQ